jgi:hypothetical protein
MLKQKYILTVYMNTYIQYILQFLSECSLDILFYVAYRVERLKARAKEKSGQVVYEFLFCTYIL